MAWRDTVKVYARCPRHVRFDPSNGSGAIKAGCSQCWELTQMYQELEKAKCHIKSFRDATAAPGTRRAV
jgi:hypothetical protein